MASILPTAFHGGPPHIDQDTGLSLLSSGWRLQRGTAERTRVWLAAGAGEPKLTADHIRLLCTTTEAIDVTLAKILGRKGGSMASNRAHMPLIW